MMELGDKTDNEYEKQGGYYCSYHRKPCPASYCIERISEGKSYCARHTSVCQSSYCSERTASDKPYCSRHSKYCSERYCCERIGEKESYCSSHNGSNYCATNGCYQKPSLSFFKYCSSCQTKNNRVQQQERQKQAQRQQAQATEQNQLKSLVKANTNISGEIKEVERFSTD
jgi:hypothetical protein